MTKTIPCPWCGGDKTVDLPYLNRAYLTVICPTCDGDGEIEADDEDDEERIINCVWRNAATPFARNH